MRNHSARVYLYPTVGLPALLYDPAAERSKHRSYGRGCLRKCALAGLQKQHGGFTIHPEMFSSLLRQSRSRKLGQGLSRFRCNFLGSEEISQRDVTETQRKPFRVQVCDFTSVAVTAPCQVKEAYKKKKKNWRENMRTWEQNNKCFSFSVEPDSANILTEGELNGEVFGHDSSHFQGRC